MNDGVDCPLARVYSKHEAIRVLNRFVNHRIELNQLAWDQVFLLRLVIALAERQLPSPNRSWLARHFGWNLYVISTKSS
jgi:hypothetical protein